MTSLSEHPPPDDAGGAPSFSVFLSNYNHGKFLARALTALLAQSVQPRVIHVVDDGSTDDSVSIIQDFARRHPVIETLYYAENRGLLRNMRDWLEVVPDDYLYFAAADDIVLPGLFEDSLALLRRHPDAGLCSALTGLIDESGADLGDFRTPVPIGKPGYIDRRTVAARLMRDDSWFTGATTIFRRQALRDIGGFDADLAGFTDGFASRVIALTHGACFIPTRLAAWRRMDAGMAGRTIGDPATARRVMERAGELMSGVHAGVFPDGYKDRWRARWMFGAAAWQLRRLRRRDALRGLRELRLPISGPDWAVISVLDALPFARRWAILGWLALRMRPHDVLPAVRRGLSRAFIGD